MCVCVCVCVCVAVGWGRRYGRAGTGGGGGGGTKSSAEATDTVGTLLIPPGPSLHTRFRNQEETARGIMVTLSFSAGCPPCRTL